MRKDRRNPDKPRWKRTDPADDVAYSSSMEHDGTRYFVDMYSKGFWYVYIGVLRLGPFASEKKAQRGAEEEAFGPLWTLAQEGKASPGKTRKPKKNPGLVWDWSGGDDPDFVSASPFTDVLYIIGRKAGDRAEFGASLVLSGGFVSLGNRHASMEEAKAAAEADFDQRFPLHTRTMPV